MADSLQEILVDLADRGLKVMFVAYPDACRACRKLQGRVFDPLEAPSIPVDECLTPPCRCRYEAYDPRVVVAKLLAAGVDAVKEQRLEEAKEMLYQVIDLDERNAKAWLWLSGVVEGTDERIICLENVLTIIRRSEDDESQRDNTGGGNASQTRGGQAHSTGDITGVRTGGRSGITP
jgi:hypothetical protein